MTDYLTVRMLSSLLSKFGGAIVQQRSQSKRSHAHAKRHAATAYLGLSDHGV